MKTEDIIPVTPQRQVAKDHLTRIKTEVVHEAINGDKDF
jgi:hypothetical protein